MELGLVKTKVHHSFPWVFMFPCNNKLISLILIYSLLATLIAEQPTFFSREALTIDTNLARNECDFYAKVLERKYPCGDAGYALGYAEKYCRAFDANREEFSEKGKRWRLSTMRCLISSMRKFLLENHDNQSLSCDSIQSYGFDSHPVCYTSSQPSFCELSLNDYRLILKVISRKSLISKQGRKQIAQVARICLGKINPWEDDQMNLESKNHFSEKVKLLEEIAQIDTP